jgi:hypothetical protein
VQNIASGNTMVLSHDVLMAQKKVQPDHSVWHDWTTYLVSTALGGQVYFDNVPSLLYRQHCSNVIGANDGISAQFKRLKPLFKGRFKQWTDANLAAVHDLGGLATSNAQDLHHQFSTLRTMPTSWSRFNSWRKIPIRRQTAQSNLSLAISLIFSLS